MTAPGQAFLTFQEVRRYEKVDVVFVGSSHAYRSFDPRVFAREGLARSIFDASADTVEQLHLLKESSPFARSSSILKRIRSFSGTMAGGRPLTSLTISPLSLNLARMAGASWDVSVWNKLFLRWMGPDLPAVSDRAEILPASDTYVGRGYVEKDPRHVDPRAFQPESVVVSPDQMAYLELSIRMLRNQGIHVVMVVTPSPCQTVAGILNYRRRRAGTGRTVPHARPQYIDFNLGGQLDLTAPTSTTPTTFSSRALSCFSRSS